MKHTKARLVATLGLILLAFATENGLCQDSDGDGLPDEYERGFGRYEMVSGNFTWQEAKADAEKRGGHLATIVSQAEWDSILGVLGNFYSEQTIWIGGADATTEGTWKWVTGETWGYARWSAGEPNNVTDEDYTDIIGNGFWNDHNAAARHGYYLFERGFYTDPKNPDSDGDGVKDGDEIAAGSLPNDSSSKPLPKIATQPKAVEVNLGATAMFSVQAVGIGVLRYQWRFNGARIVGATLPTLELSNVTAMDEGDYIVEVADNIGSTASDSARLTIFHDADGDGLSDDFEKGNGPYYEIVAGTFTWHEAKADAERRGGHLATITSQAESDHLKAKFGNALLSKWLGATDELAEGQWKWVTGEPWGFARWHSLQPDSSGGNQDYLWFHSDWGLDWDDIQGDLRVGYLLEREFNTDPHNPDTDGDGFSDGVEYEAGSTPTDPNNRPLPKILAQPRGGGVPSGISFSMTISANGYGPLTFQWRRNEAPITGATNSMLTISSVLLEDAGNYDVVLRNSGGSVTSAVATVTVTPSLEIQILDNGFILIQLTDYRALNWQIEHSEDLVSWKKLGPMPYYDGLGAFLDVTAVGSRHRFYRASAP